MGGGSHGGHGHHDAHKPPAPYDLPHSAPYPSEAHPFGLVPGAPAEGWELITYSTYLACFLLLTVGMSSKENDSFTAWARREALAREEVVANGGEIEFGKYYQNRGYEETEMDTMPKMKDE